MDYEIAHRRAVAASTVIGWLLFLPLLCLLAGLFTTDEYLREILGKSFLYGFVALFLMFFLVSLVAIAFRFLKWLYSTY